MTTSAPIDPIQQFLWDRMQDAAMAEQAWRVLPAVLNPYFIGIVIILAFGMLFALAGLLAYRPRIPRGALWIPAYGIFGGRPKLYYHTRPASLFGVFLHSRRHASSRSRG